MTARPASLLLAQQRLYLTYLPLVRMQFGHLPGVVLIGLGAKERAGQLTPEWAFRFYVNQKRPVAAVPAGELIPAYLFGIQTDVIPHFETESLVCGVEVLSVDSASYRDTGIRGGIAIRNDHFDNDQPSGYGTLGILARRKTDNALVGLTCAHVVNAASQDLTAVNTKIGQPKYWITCCCCPHGYIGDVAKATFNADLDCAIITIHDDIAEKVAAHTTEHKIEGLATPVTGAAALVCFDTVSKRGRATGLTTGKVSDIAYGTNQMLIERTGGTGDVPFACHGDSGAVVVNSSGQVVGLVVAAARDNMRRTIVTHIKPVMLELGITIAATDAATIGEPLGGGPTGCELFIWPGGQADTALNPVEEFTSADFGFSGPVSWDVSKGAGGAVILQTGSQQATGLEAISVRYDTASASKNPTDTVQVQAISGDTHTKFRTVFTFTPRAVNTSAPLDANNSKSFAATGGTTNLAGAAVPVDAGDWFMAKAEIIFDISPQHMSWSGGGAIAFVAGAPAGLKGNIIARREIKFARGEQVNGTPNRLHQDQPAFAAGTPSTADDFQAPTDALPNTLFRLANEGFDPAILLQAYLRAEYRDYLEFNTGNGWTRITGYAEWFANLTGALNAAPPPAAGTPNALGTGANTGQVPNQKPAVTAVESFREILPGEKLTLRVTATDADNDVVTIGWAQTDGPPTVLSTTTGPAVEFTAPAGDFQFKFTATAKDSTETLSRTAGNFLSDPAEIIVNVIEWLHREGGSPTLADNETEDFTAADFGIGGGLLNWDITTGNVAAVIIEAGGIAMAATGTVNTASGVKVRYDTASADLTRGQTVKVQATNPANGKTWYKRRTVRTIEWLQRCGGYADITKNATEVFTSADLGMAGNVNWDVSTGGAQGFIVETGGTQANGRASITVRYDQHSADATRANTVIIRATDPADAANFNYKRRSVVRVTLSLRNTGTIEPAPENEDYATSTAAAGGIDTLGPLPMGQGRADVPGDAYTSPIQVVAELVGYLPATVFRWKRFITRRSWIIQRNVIGTEWNVTQRSRRGFPDDDTGGAAFNDATPSALHRLYIYDNSGIAFGPAGGAATNALGVGAFVYEEKAFNYQVQRQDGANWVLCAEIDIGQRIIGRRDDDTGTVTTDWVGVENSTAVRVVSATVTEAEVRGIVAGALTINIDANANN